METVKQDGRMNTENYQQRKLRQALLMKRLTNFIPLVGTAVLAALFFAVCIVKGYEIDTNLIVVIKRAMIIGFLATGASFIFAIGSFDLSLGANMLDGSDRYAHRYCRDCSLSGSEASGFCRNR